MGGEAEGEAEGEWEGERRTTEGGGGGGEGGETTGRTLLLHDEWREREAVLTAALAARSARLDSRHRVHRVHASGGAAGGEAGGAAGGEAARPRLAAANPVRAPPASPAATQAAAALREAAAARREAAAAALAAQEAGGRAEQWRRECEGMRRTAAGLDAQLHAARRMQEVGVGASLLVAERAEAATARYHPHDTLHHTLTTPWSLLLPFITPHCTLIYPHHAPARRGSRRSAIVSAPSPRRAWSSGGVTAWAS